MADVSELEIESPSSGMNFPGAEKLTRERILSFRVIYVAVFAFLVLYTSTVWVAEITLDRHFERLAIEASHVTDLDVAVATQIQQAMGDLDERSPWVTIGGIRVTSLVLGSDGLSWIYVHGRIRPQQEGLKPTEVLRQAVEEDDGVAVDHSDVEKGDVDNGHTPKKRHKSVYRRTRINPRTIHRSPTLRNMPHLPTNRRKR